MEKSSVAINQLSITRLRLPNSINSCLYSLRIVRVLLSMKLYLGHIHIVSFNIHDISFIFQRCRPSVVGSR